MSELRETVLAYLRDHNCASLATCGPDGPWAATVFYASDGFDLYFFSSPKSRHSQNLDADPRAAATVNEDYSEWQAIKGIQLEGTVERLDGLVEKARALTVYVRKFPFVQSFFGAPGDLATDMARKVTSTVMYRLRPERVYFVDNAKGFGKRGELSGEALHG